MTTSRTTCSSGDQQDGVNENDLILVINKLRESDDDIVVCIIDEYGAMFEYSRAFVRKLSYNQISIFARAGGIVKSFTSDEGITWLTEEDATHQYPEWGGYRKP